MSGDDTRTRILEAATKVFSEHGYAGATTRAIAAAADLTEVTLFRHFGTKKNLFQEMVVRNSALPEVDRALQTGLSGDYQRDLEMLCTYILTMLVERRKEILVSLAEAERQPDLKEIITVVPDRLRGILADYLVAAGERGQLRSLDPEMAAQALLGMLLSYSISLTVLPDEMAARPLPEVAGEFVALFAHGTLA